MSALFIYTASVPVQLTARIDTLMKKAAELGVNTGRDHDWTPECVEEALWEIIIMSGDPKSHGVIVLPEQDLDRDDVFILRIDIHGHAYQDEIIAEAKDLLPEGWPATFSNAICCALQSQASPVDFGFEIEEPHLPSLEGSAHQKIETVQSLERAYRKAPK